MADYEQSVASCIHGQPPPCAANCPFSFLDIRQFVQCCVQGRVDAAFRMLEDAFLLPDIVTELCPGYCRGQCTETNPVRIDLLERYVCDVAKRRKPRKLNLPVKDKSIGIVGAGLDGLAIALRLSQRRYDVTVFLDGDVVGAIAEGGLVSKTIRDSIENRFSVLDCRFADKVDRNALAQADAVYVCAGHDAPSCPEPGLFRGVHQEPILALAQGIDIANGIESFLKTGNRPEAMPAFGKIVLPPEQREKATLSADEFSAEANRCKLCDCDLCYRRCMLMQQYRRFPKPMMRDVALTVTPADLMQRHVATRLIASCSQCGACTDVCPEGIDIRALIMDARRELVRKEVIPPIFSAFWIDDMKHADDNGIVRLAPSSSRARYAFFPGCQLGASDPRYVIESYRLLLRHYPDCALFLSCCGAPLDWAGHEKDRVSKHHQLLDQWKSLGEPTLVVACPMCANSLKTALPNANVISLYTLPVFDAERSRSACAASVYDPCAARFDAPTQDAVRLLLEQMGFSLYPLSCDRESAMCCGWGGQYAIADSKLSNDAAAYASNLAETPYVTYCSNCRDTFSTHGKSSWHILDLVFDINDANREAPTITQRRRNREQLARLCLKGFWDADCVLEPSKSLVAINPTLQRRLSDDWILEQDVERTIVDCENRGAKFYDTERDVFIARGTTGLMTLWAEYRPNDTGEGWELVNAYAHRMEVQR